MNVMNPMLKKTRLMKNLGFFCFLFYFWGGFLFLREGEIQS